MYANILSANKRLQSVVHKTPILSSATLNSMTGFNIYLKCENFQRMGAFKFRGAVNSLQLLTDEQKRRGVITHSSGNHAQAIALVGKLFNIKTVIVMPDNAPQVKIKATREYGAEIVFCAPTVTDREQTTRALIEKHGYTFIHPYDNNDVIAGAGTVAVEILEELESVDAILAPVGGGGLISGTAIASKESGKVKFVFGAEPQNADDAFRSIRQNTLLPQTNPSTIADGLRTQLSELTFSYISKYVDKIITVSEEEILEALEFLFHRMKLVVEPSGAVSVAAVFKLSRQGILPQGSRIACIISGGNIDLSSFFKAIKQKLVSS